jgi:hypothetical protein
MDANCRTFVCSCQIHKTLLGYNLNEGVLNVFEDNVCGVLDVAKTSCSSHDGFSIIFKSKQNHDRL